MTLKRYTPGPWNIDQQQSRITKPWGGSKEVVICETQIPAWHEDRRCGQEEEAANALLIAAAPDLLETLQDALKRVEFERLPFRPWHDKARDAIAKATGQKPKAA